jgi:hypothetical protein
MRQRSILGILVLALAGCSGDGADDSARPEPADGKCGPGPYARITGVISSYSGGSPPIAGARLTADLCPEETITTDDEGRLELQMTIGAAYNPRVEADGFLTTRTGRQIVLGDFDGGGPMAPRALSFLFPHFDEQRPLLVVAVASSQSPPPQPDPSDPCTTRDGYAFSVEGHPEALVTYYAGDTTPQPDPALTRTGPLGLAEISGLSATSAGSLVRLSGQKEGCSSGSFESYPHTGEYRLEDGVVTLAGLFVPAVEPP